MLDKAKKTISATSTAYKRRKELTKKLVKNPFLPILFIGEAVKTMVIALFPAHPVIAFTLFAIIVTIGWVYAEVLADEASEIKDDITND